MSAGTVTSIVKSPKQEFTRAFTSNQHERRKKLLQQKINEIHKKHVLPKVTFKGPTPYSGDKEIQELIKKYPPEAVLPDRFSNS